MALNETTVKALKAAGIERPWELTVEELCRVPKLGERGCADVIADTRARIYGRGMDDPIGWPPSTIRRSEDLRSQLARNMREAQAREIKRLLDEAPEGKALAVGAIQPETTDDSGYYSLKRTYLYVDADNPVVPQEGGPYEIYSLRK